MSLWRFHILPMLGCLALLALAAPAEGVDATAYYTGMIAHGDLLPGAGNTLKVGGKDIPVAGMVGLDIDGVSPRTPDYGVRFSSGMYLAGKFTDYAAGQPNPFESESFGSFKIGKDSKDQAVLLYVGGYPGMFPELERAGKQGLIQKSGEFTAGEVVYVTAQYAGLRIDDRLRKYSLSSVYAVAVGPLGPPPTAGWRVRTINGDMLYGELSGTGLRGMIIGTEHTVPLERFSGAWNVRDTASITLDPKDRARPYRNSEGRPLVTHTQRVLPEGWWQRGDSTFALSIPAGVKGLAFRGWREPGFHRGQMMIKFQAGNGVLKELVVEPSQRVFEGVVNVTGPAEVSVSILPGNDESYGDRVIWERLTFFK